MPLPYLARAALGYYIRSRTLSLGQRKAGVRAAAAAAAAVTGGVGYIASRFRRGKQVSRKGKPLSRMSRGDPGPSTVDYNLRSKRARYADAGTVTNMSYRHVVQDHGGYVQLSVDPKKRIGHKASKRDHLDKCLEAQLLTKIDRYQYLTNVGDANGKYDLSYYISGTSPNRQYKMPLYAFDLSMLRDNWNLGSGSGYYVGVPFLRLVKVETGVAGEYNYSWDFMAGAKPDGTTGTTPDFRCWQSERSPYGDYAATGIVPTSAQAPYEKAMLNWADIRIGMWGATNNPSRIDVMICRIPDEDMQPPVTYQDSVLSTATGTTLFNTPSDAKTKAEYNVFWSSMMDNCTGNPLMVRQQVSKKNAIDVLYSRTYQYNPTMSSETDLAGHQTLCKILYDIDSLFDYRQDYMQGIAGGAGVDTITDGNPNVWKVDAGARQNTVYPRNRKSRIFLLIKGFTNQRQSDTAFSAADSPSFDLLVRRKMTII